MIYKKIHIGCLLAVMFSLLASSCSTTSKLEKGEMLYTGVKKFEVEPVKGQEVPSDVNTILFDAINIKPNNCIYSPYLRSPIPIGLWVYNHMEPAESGFKHWFYDKFVEQPVLINKVKPKLRVEMLKSILDNNGYFRGNARYELVQKNPTSKKAKISYFIDLGDPYMINSISYMGGKSRLDALIDSLSKTATYLKVGNRYCLDSLSAVRTDIANKIRNKGYYYFRPEFIEYLADSTMKKGSIALRLMLGNDIDKNALKKFYTGDVTTTVYSPSGGGVPDTIITERGKVIKMTPVRVRDSLIPSCLRFRKGRSFTVRSVDQTQLYLSRLGIFSGIDINIPPLDSLHGRDTVNVDIRCRLDKPLEASFEVQATSKSNSYVGPGLVAGLTHKNLFGGGESLNTQLTASYEWQTGKGSSNQNSVAFNSYEFGLKNTLSFPRLLAPKFVDRTRRYLNWTRISLTGDILNRPHFFKMVQFGTSFGWEWHANKNSLNTFTPFKLTYTKLLTTTAAFDSAMVANPAVALSFKNQFIPLMSYSYTYNKTLDRNNMITWDFTVSEAGNIFAGIWELAGTKGEKKLFGTPFSQFVKAQTQLVYSRRLGSNSWLVSRALIGAAHAYGNSSQVPYSEQFYIGGANSIRAFTVRSLGPGSYHPGSEVKNGYYDQTGTFKLEMNTEYRFPLVGYLHGAFFIDAGNIWLLKNDVARPGGLLKGSTFLKDIAVGTGVGLRFDMEMLVIRGDLGIGIHAPYDTGKSGYYNMTSFKKSLAFHIAIGYPF